MFQKCLFEILERTIYLGLTYSAACQICWVIWYFPVLSLDRDILYFAQERLIESSTKKKNHLIEIRNSLNFHPKICFENHMVLFLFLFLLFRFLFVFLVLNLGVSGVKLLVDVMKEKK